MQACGHCAGAGSISRIPRPFRVRVEEQRREDGMAFRLSRVVPWFILVILDAKTDRKCRALASISGIGARTEGCFVREVGSGSRERYRDRLNDGGLGYKTTSFFV